MIIFQFHSIGQLNSVVETATSAIHRLQDSVRREVLYNILTEFGVPMKLFRLIQMCLNETKSKVLIGKHLSDT
jgi:hypothetical protein